MHRKILISSAICGIIAISSQSGFANDINPLNHTDVRIAQQEVLGEARTEMSAALEKHLLSKKTTKRIEAEFGDDGTRIIRRIYATHVFNPIWTELGAADLQLAVADVFEHGIIASDVFSGDLDKLISKRFEASSPKTRAKADVKLSLIWLRFAEAMSGDLSDEAAMVKRKDSPILRYNTPLALERSAKSNASAEILSMAPEAPQYAKLKASLKTYRYIRKAGGWLAIRDGDTIELNETDERLPDLRKRLRAEGYSVGSILSEDDDNTFDSSTEAALKLFQTRHGLEDDGILGGNTLNALNESVESKISRIADSMYRWREQGELAERYIWANIPSYSAEGWNNGMLEIKQRTIVGKERFATPEFSDEVEYLVANPKWYLPVSIIRRQKVPKLKRDPGYAAKYGYNIFDRETGAPVDAFSVDWSEPGVSRKYQFVQQAGDGNALGEMKIIFPNQYSVYLHGTPGEHLFDRAQRAFSSGCVRLEDPVSMAKWIARGDEAAEVSTIKEAMMTEENTRVSLGDHLPVHITYFTVTVAQDGTPYFWRDVYDRLDDSIKYVKKYEQKADKKLAELDK